jgi:hypothetical protein
MFHILLYGGLLSFQDKNIYKHLTTDDSGKGALVEIFLMARLGKKQMHSETEPQHSHNGFVYHVEKE